MTKFEFGGISGTIDKAVVGRFAPVYDNGYDQIHDEQEIRTHVDEDFEFNYYYAVQVLDLYEATGEVEHKDKFAVELHLMVHPSSMCADMIEEIADSCSLSSEDELTSSDFIWYGTTVTMASDTITGEENVQEAVEAAMSCVTAVDGLRGLYLDNPWNRIGTTGWDTILFAIGKQERLFNF